MTATSAAGGRPTATAAGGRALAVGGTLLAAAGLIANAGNYGVNVVLGRWLTPQAFADATVVTSVWLTCSALALSLQFVAARYVGRDPESADTMALTVRLSRCAAALGFALAVLVGAGAPLWQRVFHTESAWVFVLLAVGLPAHLLLSVGRGVLQGRLDFARMSASLLVEMVVRVALSTVLVVAGFGAVGAVAGLTGSLLATWLLVRRHCALRPPAVGTPVRGVGRYAGAVLVLLAAQALLTNADTFVAKAFLPGPDAARYAAVALVGRGVFFCAAAVATVVFPAVARRHAEGIDSERLLRGALVAVLALGTAGSAAVYAVGDAVIGGLLGSAYAGLGTPLALAAGAATCFALANLIATHHLSVGRVRESVLMLAGAVAQLTVLLAYHPSVQQIACCQLVGGVVLLTVLLASHRHASVRAGRSRRPARASAPTPAPAPAPARSIAVTPSIEPPAAPAPTPYQAYRSWAVTPLTSPPVLSVVIPAYNEEIRILPTVAAIATHLSTLGTPWELIVADDGSTDGTVGILQALGWANLRVLVAERNGGKGSAVRRGMQAAQGRYVLFADADQSTPIEQYSALLAALERGHDVAIGSRAAAGAGVHGKSLHRRILSGGLRALVAVAFGMRVADTQCGFKLFTAEAASTLFARQVVDGFSFDLEVLYLAHRLGMSIAEVPVEWIDAPGSTVDAAKVTAEFLVELVRIRLFDLRGGYRLRAAAEPRQQLTRTATLTEVAR